LARALATCARERKFVRELGAAGSRTFDRHFTLDRFASRFAELLVSLGNRPHEARSENSNSYDEWMARFDSPTPVSRALLRRELRASHRHPLISIVLPVYNPELPFLRAAVASIQNQIYERWELCIADDASTDPQIRPFLEELATMRE
jgi:hypothetical protein